MNSIHTVRLARHDEAAAACSVMIAARHANLVNIPALVHTDVEVHQWFASIVMTEQTVWVAVAEPTAPASASVIEAMMVVSPGWIEHLYVAPERVNLGLGSMLVQHATSRVTGPLDLWTFAQNHGARRFYERHGFVEVERTDGDNEEGAPDIRYRWTPVAVDAMTVR